MSALTLNLNAVDLTDDQYYQLCQNNREVRFERTEQGWLIIMTPVGGEGGNQEAELITDVNIWNRRAGEPGLVFSSSTGFKLPSGADRSPDVAWVRKERWEALTPEQRRKFPPLAPDFVIELRSVTDDLQTLQDKMQEYRNNGVPLGWLINPQDQQVEIYRLGCEVERLSLPAELSGEAVLPKFTLKVRQFVT